MKPLLIAGIVVAIVGVLMLTGRLSLPTNRSVVRVGDLEASVQEQRAMPLWAGIVALAGGALMIGIGLRGRKA